MVKFVLVILLMVSKVVNADFLGLGDSKYSNDGLANLIAKLGKLDIKNDTSFEDNFNQISKNIEQAIEEGKLVCSGEVTPASGKVVDKEQRQLCFRDLKKQYLEALDLIFETKKKFLTQIHDHQIEKMSEIQKNLKADIDKSF